MNVDKVSNVVDGRSSFEIPTGGINNEQFQVPSTLPRVTVRLDKQIEIDSLIGIGLVCAYIDIGIDFWRSARFYN